MDTGEDGTVCSEEGDVIIVFRVSGGGGLRGIVGGGFGFVAVGEGYELDALASGGEEIFAVFQKF